MNRFFIPPKAVQGNEVLIPDEISAQIRKVLRLKDGTHVQFLDNRGGIYESVIRYPDEKQITAEVVQKLQAEDERICVSLYIGLTQREKFEWILQKCTEAGVGEIIPVISERTLIRKASDVSGKQERWEKILREASEQCGRARIPVLRMPMTFGEAVRQGAKADRAVFCWEEEHQQSLSEVLSGLPDGAGTIAVMVGPEGGFSSEEAAAAGSAGWAPVTLGKRIYRMETAALVAVVLTLYETEKQASDS